MELVTIKMKKTARGSEFGWDVSTFEEGKVYKTTPALAKCFLEAQLADYSNEEGDVTPTISRAQKARKR